MDKQPEDDEIKIPDDITEALAYNLSEHRTEEQMLSSSLFNAKLVGVFMNELLSQEIDTDSALELSSRYMELMLLGGQAGGAE